MMYPHCEMMCSRDPFTCTEEAEVKREEVDVMRSVDGG